MTLLHPDNPLIKCKLPLFAFDRDQNYSLLMLGLIGNWLKNKSKHLPLRGKFDTLNGYFLIDTPFYVQSPAVWDYADKLLNCFAQYSGTDFHLTLQSRFPSETLLFNQEIIFPNDFSIEENELDIELTCPLAIYSYTVMVTALYNYKQDSNPANTISDFKIIYCPVKGGTTPRLKIPKKIFESAENFYRYLNYGSVIITVRGLEDSQSQQFEENLNSQWLGAERFFLAKNFNEFLSYLQAQITQLTSDDQFKVPTQINMRQYWGYRISGYRFSPSSEEDHQSLANSQREELLATFIGLGVPDYVLTSNWANSYSRFTFLTFFDQESLNGDSSQIMSTIFGTPSFIVSSTWENKPERYKEWALIRPYPVGEHLSSFRRDDDLYSNDQNTFWVSDYYPRFIQPFKPPISGYLPGPIYTLNLNDYTDEEAPLVARVYIRGSLYPLPPPSWTNYSTLYYFGRDDLSPEFDFFDWKHPLLVEGLQNWQHNMAVLRAFQLEATVNGKNNSMVCDFCTWSASDTVPDKEGNFQANWNAQEELNQERWFIYFLDELDYTLDVLETRTEEWTMTPVIFDNEIPVNYLSSSEISHTDYYLSLI